MWRVLNNHNKWAPHKNIFHINIMDPIPLKMYYKISAFTFIPL